MPTFESKLASKFALVCLVLCVNLLYAQTSTNQPAQAASRSVGAKNERLPVKRVVLYKNGVGYFEHTGRIHGGQDVDVDFTTGQLNDVLKSLAIVDLGGGRVSSVRYNSVAPLNERLKSLRLPVSGETNAFQFLNALRGAAVEVRSGGTTAAGHLLSVERRQKPRGENSVVQTDEITIVSEAGDMRVFELGSGVSVRLVDRDLAKEVSRYMQLMSSTREKDVRRMTISTEGIGDRDLFVSYISEVPIWKSTYRVILPKDPGEKAILQGWAIVDNTVGEDWNDVQLSLVAGAPQSFVQNLAQPYYTQRPVIGLPEYAQLTPQTHEGTMEDEKESAEDVAQGPQTQKAVASRLYGFAGESMGGYGGGVFRTGLGIAGVVTDSTGAVIPASSVIATSSDGRQMTTTTDAEGRFKLYVTPGSYDIRINKYGFKEGFVKGVQVLAGKQTNVRLALNPGAASETVEVTASAVTVDPTSMASSTNLTNEFYSAAGSAFESAEAKPIAEMFEYRLKEKVSIAKNQSALVPIISAKVDAEKVTLWNPGSEHPMRALWLDNSSGLTLDSGSFNVLDGGSFGGEGVWDLMKPDEKRLISYAAEDGVRIESENLVENGRVTHVSIYKGSLIQKQGRENKTIYKIHNEDLAPRTVVIEHPQRDGWTLAGDAKPAETSKDYLRFKIQVDSKKTVSLPVVERHDDETRWLLTNLNDSNVAYFIQQKSITPQMEQALKRVLDKKRSLFELDLQMGSRNQEISKISQDQARVRENMKALKGSSEEKQLIQRYTRDLNAQEDRLETLRNEIEDLANKRTSTQADLDQTIKSISMDADI
jgi:hypothetical protein